MFFWIFFEKFGISFSWKYSKLKTNVVVDISAPIPYLAKFWFSSYGPKCCRPIKLQDTLKCNISRKKWIMKFIFWHADKQKFSTSWYCYFGCSLPAMPKVPKISLHTCNISRKTRGMKFIFLPAEKHKFSTSW